MKKKITEQIPCGVAILAAGASRRMGRQKLLLPWGETSVLGHLIEQWRKLGCRQIAIVCVADAKEIESELARLNFPTEDRIINPTPEEGMFSSVQCAAAWENWDPELTHWIITLGDQPQLQEKTLRALLEFAAVHPEKICQPQRNGRVKHPVLFPKKYFSALKDSPVTDLKEFLKSHQNDVAGFESDDAGLDFDLDEPADYERAKGMGH